MQNCLANGHFVRFCRCIACNCKREYIRSFVRSFVCVRTQKFCYKRERETEKNLYLFCRSSNIISIDELRCCPRSAYFLPFCIQNFRVFVFVCLCVATRINHTFSWPNNFDDDVCLQTFKIYTTGRIATTTTTTIMMIKVDHDER